MSEPNYRQLTPPEDKSPDEYSYVERRAELYDMIESAGHYRNLERTQRQLGNRYGVSKTQIQKDIRRINEWRAEHLGENAEAELDTLKTKAIQECINNQEYTEAYYLMSKHYSLLQEMGLKQREPEKHEVSGVVIDMGLDDPEDD